MWQVDVKWPVVEDESGPPARVGFKSVVGRLENG